MLWLLLLSLRPNLIVVLALTSVAFILQCLTTFHRGPELYWIQFTDANQATRLNTLHQCVFSPAATWICTSPSIGYRAQHASNITVPIDSHDFPKIFSVSSIINISLLVTAFAVTFTSQFGDLVFSISLAALTTITTLLNFLLTLLLLTAATVWSNQLNSLTTLGPAFYLNTYNIAFLAIALVISLMRLKEAWKKKKELMILESLLAAEEKERHRYFELRRQQSLGAFSYNTTPSSSVSKPHSRMTSRDGLRKDSIDELRAAHLESNPKYKRSSATPHALDKAVGMAP